MVYAQIKNGLIVGAIAVDETTVLALFAEGFDHLLRIDDLIPQPGIGWSYDGQHFSPPVLPPDPIADVTPRQIRQAMIISGISLTSIETALSSLPEPTQSLARVEWEYSIAFQRNRPLVIQMGAMLGFTSGQLDAVWKLAASL